MTIVIEIFMICNTICTTLDTAMFDRADAYLEKELNTEVEFVFREEKINLAEQRRFDNGDLITLNRFLRMQQGTEVANSKKPKHIYGFIINGKAQYVGQAELFRDGNAFYVVKEHGNDKTIAHEVLHLYGYAHNQDRMDIMKEGTPCPDAKTIMECTNTGEHTFWEIDHKH